MAKTISPQKALFWLTVLWCLGFVLIELSGLLGPGGWALRMLASLGLGLTMGFKMGRVVREARRQKEKDGG